MHPASADHLTGTRVPTTPELVAVPVIAVAVILTAVLYWVLGWLALPVALLAAVALGYLLVAYSTPAIISLVEAEPVSAETNARLVNVVEGLALSAGVATPALRVTSDPGINAMAIGSAGKDTMLVVTQGAVDKLDRIELEGLMAHTVSRLRGPRQRARCTAVTTRGLGRYLLDRFGSNRGKGTQDLSTEDQAAIDADAVAITRFPPGLLAALEKAQDMGTTVAAARPCTSHLWLAAVDSSDADQLAVRADALREL